jgi:aspartyl-tRNA(Asn)/glutamyl-tRNA(Gln) amidotransferase subunit A
VATLDLSTVSAAALARHYRDGTITPYDATEWFLDRIEATTDRAIFIAVTAVRARREAAASTARHREGKPLGPLDGVPVAWKDLFDLEGTTTTAGSDIYRSAPKVRNSPIRDWVSIRISARRAIRSTRRSIVCRAARRPVRR